MTSSPHNEQQQQEDFSAAGVWFLSALLVLLSTILFALVVHVLCRRRQMQLLMEARNAFLSSNGSNNADVVVNETILEERIERRYETIEAWMISKRILRHDEFCSSCIHPLVKSNLTGDATSHESLTSPNPVDLEASVDGTSPSLSGMECPICFDEFRTGEIVSFSANEECNHVFHHECIKEWLLRHTNCPFCRSICVQTDHIRGKHHNQELLKGHIQEYVRKHSYRSATTIYCSKAGLLSIPSQVHCTTEELTELTSRVRGSIVDRAILAKHRKTTEHIQAWVKQSSSAATNDANQNAGDLPSAPRQRIPSRSSLGSLPGGLDADLAAYALEEDLADVESDVAGICPPQDLSDAEASDVIVAVSTENRINNTASGPDDQAKEGMSITATTTFVKHVESAPPIHNKESEDSNHAQTTHPQDIESGCEEAKKD